MDVWSSCAATDSCGSRLLLSLPEDALSIICASLLPRDLCNLSLCCRALRSLDFADELWFDQCCITGLLPVHDLPKWRSYFHSCRALCRFLVSVRPLLGIWVQRNAELGKVVFATLGFLSLVACRVSSDDLGVSLVGARPLRWAPVFEIVAEPDGSAAFFLHGSHSDADFLYPGVVKSIQRNCNLLLLEIGPGSGGTGEGFLVGLEPDARHWLLRLVSNQVCLEVRNSPNWPSLFPQSGCDLGLLGERRARLIQMHHSLNGGAVNWRLIRELNSQGERICNGNGNGAPSLCSNWHRYLLQSFLRANDTIGLSIYAFHAGISYRGREIYNERYALYKLPLQAAALGQDYAGLWGGSFGWPAQGALGRHLFLLSISYQVCGGRPTLIATNIYEDSPVFTAKVDELSFEPFPWGTDETSVPIEINHVYNGVSGSNPGSLFVMQNGLLAFVWKESMVVLTLQRLDLQGLLKKGEQVAARHSISNFCI